MSRHSTRLAWSLWGLAVIALVIATALHARNWFAIDWDLLTWSGKKGPVDLIIPAVITAAGLAYATVGALVIPRVPGNAVGWLCLVLGLYFGLLAFAEQYSASVAGAAGGALTLPRLAGVAALLMQALLTLWVLPVALLLLLFPTGRLPGRRWRWVVWAALAGAGSLTLLAVTEPILYPESIAVRNPLGPLALRPVGLAIAPISKFAAMLAFAVTVALLALIGAGLSVVARWRRAVGRERQQLKWLAYIAGITGGAGLCAGLGAWVAVGTVGSVWNAGLPGSAAFLFGGIVLVALLVGVPVVIGIAILRHHLYDIDLIIRGTLIYGALTAALALVYGGAAVLLQRLLDPVLGPDNQLAIVASTLLIAALSQPLRRRIQAAIDRRFYRRKYDANLALAAFGTALRDETDLARLQTSLLGVVRETMQPVHAALWLRASAGRARGRYLPRHSEDS